MKQLTTRADRILNMADAIAESYGGQAVGVERRRQLFEKQAAPPLFAHCWRNICRMVAPLRHATPQCRALTKVVPRTGCRGACVTAPTVDDEPPVRTPAA